ncbi:MAG: hypothetical protein LBC75_01070 [Fibromonadaceae bacterium]|jgi:hypothetical protein|nr:hypothetical protein [Fibromonadaceae bacterium]
MRIDEANADTIAIAVKNGIIEAVEHFLKEYRIDLMPGNEGYFVSLVKLNEDWRSL